MASPTYALVFAALVLATNTSSFSVSNESAIFGARLTTLCTVAVLAQLRIGGRASLVPAALVTSLAVLSVAVVAAHQSLAPADGTLRFLPIPALTGLAFVCLMTAGIGIEGGVRAQRSLRGHHAVTGPSLGLPDLGETAFAEFGRAGTSEVRGSS